MARDRVARPSLDLPQRAFELVVRECLDLPAVVADKVVMMLAVGVDRLVPRDAGSDVDPLHEPVPRQLLE